jgi:hypothetical protein
MANKAYQFPQGEPNPFSDKAAGAAPGQGENPFAVSHEPVRSVDPGPGAYQQTLQQRSGMLLTFSILGLIGSLAALACSFFFLPIGIFSLLESIPALLMSRHDLLAMRAGAMEPSQKNSVTLAWVFALVGTILGVISLGICAALFFMFL